MNTQNTQRKVGNNLEEAILKNIRLKHNKRNQIALLYAQLIDTQLKETNWEKVNQAIMDRWSEAGLAYIKNRAWKLLEGG